MAGCAAHPSQGWVKPIIARFAWLGIHAAQSLRVIQALFSPPLCTMPIYAYKCESCGHAKDVLQKMSDAPLSECPACGAPTFKKQLTAAGFQLKGSGWYVTDFRGGDSGAKAPAAASGESPAPPADGVAAAKPAEAGAASAPAAAPAVHKPAAPAATPAVGGNSSPKAP